MTDQQIYDLYGGYTDEELRQTLEKGLPEWQAKLFRRLLLLREKERRRQLPWITRLDGVWFGAIGILVLGLVCVRLAESVLPVVVCLLAIPAIGLAIWVFWRFARKAKWDRRTVGICVLFGLFLYGTILSAIEPVGWVSSALLRRGLQPPTVEGLRYGVISTGLDLWKSRDAQAAVLAELAAYEEGFMPREQRAYGEFRTSYAADKAGMIWRIEAWKGVRNRDDFVTALKRSIREREYVEGRNASFAHGMNQLPAAQASYVVQAIQGFLAPQRLEQDAQLQAQEFILIGNGYEPYGQDAEINELIGKLMQLVTVEPPADPEKPKGLDLGQFSVQAMQSMPWLFHKAPDTGRAANPELDAYLRQFDKFLYAPDYEALGHPPSPP